MLPNRALLRRTHCAVAAFLFVSCCSAVHAAGAGQANSVPVAPTPPTSSPRTHKPPALQSVVANLLSIDLTSCPDPECCAAIVSCWQKQVADAYIEAYYAQASLVQMSTFSDHLSSLRTLAASNTPQAPISECDTRLALIPTDKAHVNDIFMDKFNALKAAFCCTAEPTLVDELAPPKLRYSDEQVLAISRANCRCEAEIAECLKRYHRKDNDATSLLGASNLASDTLTSAYDGYKFTVTSFDLAARSALLQDTIAAKLIAARRERDLAATALEFSVGCSVFTLHP